MIDEIRAGGRSRASAAMTWIRVHRRGILRGIATVVLAAVALGIVWFSWTYAGPLATVVYVLMFMAGLSFLPGVVVVLRDIVPNFVGRLLFALGQLGYGGSWLVQTGDGWTVCPRRRFEGNEQYWYAGDWHEIADDSNMTRLGWARWGICWHKTDDDLARYRVDDQASDDYEELKPDPDAPDAASIARMSAEDVLHADQNGAVADGGHADLVADPPEQLLSKQGVWVVNFRALWQDRIQAIGETDLLDDVERVAQRDEALAQTVSQNRILISSGFGLVLGAATGYVAMVGF